jgi:hypothetical protein
MDSAGTLTLSISCGACSTTTTSTIVSFSSPPAIIGISPP